MPDDWSWFFAGEHGRDRMLREEIEGLQASAASADSQSARLSSQLRTLQGSLETRLQALSTAFDAYVELGDVRQELAGYPDSSAVRRDAVRAVEELSRGARPDPVDDRDLDYWLSGAVNELTELLADPAGAPAGTGEATRAGQTAPEAELFVVAAAGALGRGERVAARVAPLLVADAALSPHQVVLWEAVRSGVYGDVLPAVLDGWRPSFDVAADPWVAWARARSGSDRPLEALRFLDRLVRGEPLEPRAPDVLASPAGPSPATPGGDPRRERLMRLVRTLVDDGYREERALLDRARVLRARIEDPTAWSAGDRPEPAGVAVGEVVQQALLDPATPTASRALLTSFVRPALGAAAVALYAEQAAVAEPGVALSTEMGNLRVGADGPDQQRLAHLEAITAQTYATSRAALVVPAVAAGTALVLGLVLLLTRLSGLGVALLVVAAVLVGVGARSLLRQRAARSTLAGVRSRTSTRIADATATASRVRRAWREDRAEAATLVRAITGDRVPEPLLVD